MKKIFRIIKRDGLRYTLKRGLAYIISHSPLAYRLSFAYTNTTRLAFTPALLTYAIFANRATRHTDVDILTSHLKLGAVAIDVGANIGSITIPLAETVGTGGTVIAFEPSPKFAHIIKTNLALNNFSKQAVVHAVALGATDGTVHLNEAVADDTTNHISDSGTPVTQAPLDNFTTHLPKIDLLKIDVEGYELEVLKGAPNTLTKTKVIYIEFIPRLITRAGAKPTEVLDILRQNFDLFIPSTSDAPEPFIYAADSNFETDIIGINTAHVHNV